jgi:hypothetical protein
MLIRMRLWSSNHPVKFCLDHRVALAGDCISVEGDPIERIRSGTTCRRRGPSPDPQPARRAVRENRRPSSPALPVTYVKAPVAVQAEFEGSGQAAPLEFMPLRGARAPRS